MIIEDVTGILEDKKRYLHTKSGKVHTGKAWLTILDRSPYEHIYAEDLKSLVEVTKDIKTKTWVEVKRRSPE